MPRRKFVVSASLMVLGSRLFGTPFSSQPYRDVQELKEELTSEEKKWIEESSMAKKIPEYFGQGYSCAESLMMVSLRCLGKPEDLIWVASGFGGGLYHKDLCGFLTSGIMAIGLSAGMLNKEKKEAKEHCKHLVKEYWKWWTSYAPLHCCEIRKEGTSSKVCRRLGQLAAVKIEELIGTDKAAA